MTEATTTLTRAAIKPLPEGEQLKDDWWHPLADVSDYVLPIEFENFPPGGRIDLLGAGRQSPNYAVKVNSFNWQNFYERLGGGGFLDAVKNSAAQQYDYILIDSRTGVSDTAGICTAQLPDTLVACFTYNNQSIKGTQAVADSAILQRQELAVDRRKRYGQGVTETLAYTPRPYRIFPVPMRADTSESDRLLLRQSFARESFNAILDTCGIEDKAKYWAGVEVPYWPFYAYEEILSPLRDDPNSKKTVLYAFTQIAGYLTDGEINGYSLPLSPILRQQYLDAFAETRHLTSINQAALEASKETAEQLMLRRADEVIHSLANEDKNLARSVLCRLMRIGKAEEGGRHYPIRMSTDEFGQKQKSMLALLADRELLAITSRSGGLSSSGPSEQVVSFADERLSLLWPTLRDWLNDDREFLLWRQQLREYRGDWTRTSEKAALLAGTLLAEAQRWERLRSVDLNDAERAFIAESAIAVYREEISPGKHKKWTTAIVAVASLAVTGVTLVLSNSNQSSEFPLVPAASPAKFATVPVPNFVGNLPDEARTIAQAVGLRLLTYDDISGAEWVATDGIVARQAPAPQVPVEAGSTVRLYITPDYRTVPSVAGLDKGGAIEVLRKSGLRIEIGSSVSSANAKVKPGTIVKQEPDAGSRIVAGKFVVVHIAEESQPLQNKGALNGYKVDIFYYQGEAVGEQLAEKIAAHLKQSGLSQIGVRPSSIKFMRSFSAPQTVEIRFESGTEDAPASALQELLRKVDGVGSLRRFAVVNKTPQYLSIFIPSVDADVRTAK